MNNRNCFSKRCGVCFNECFRKSFQPIVSSTRVHYGKARKSSECDTRLKYTPLDSDDDDHDDVDDVDAVRDECQLRARKQKQNELNERSGVRAASGARARPLWCLLHVDYDYHKLLLLCATQLNCSLHMKPKKQQHNHQKQYRYNFLLHGLIYCRCRWLSAPAVRHFTHLHLDWPLSSVTKLPLSLLDAWNADNVLRTQQRTNEIMNHNNLIAVYTVRFASFFPSFAAFLRAASSFSDVWVDAR